MPLGTRGAKTRVIPQGTTRSSPPDHPGPQIPCYLIIFSPLKTGHVDPRQPVLPQFDAFDLPQVPTPRDTVTRLAAERVDRIEAALSTHGEERHSPKKSPTPRTSRAGSCRSILASGGALQDTCSRSEMMLEAGWDRGASRAIRIETEAGASALDWRRT